MRKLFLVGVIGGGLLWAAVLSWAVLRPSPLDTWVVISEKLVPTAKKAGVELRWCRKHPGKCDVEVTE